MACPWGVSTWRLTIKVSLSTPRALHGAYQFAVVDLHLACKSWNKGNYELVAAHGSSTHNRFYGDRHAWVVRLLSVLRLNSVI